jgi:hypothetical protein
MNETIEELFELLEQEREAARLADVTSLLAIQEPKQRAIESLRDTDIPPEVMEELAHVAVANIALMRHLAECLEATLHGDEAAETRYGAHGTLVAAGRAPLIAGSL